MATDYMRAMLDELMGSGGGNDDGGEGKNIQLWHTIMVFGGVNRFYSVSTKFKGRDVCRSFLLKCCPHEILNATVSTKIS